MSPQEAIQHLMVALNPDGNDKFRFASFKVAVNVKLFNQIMPLRFTAKDRVLFRVRNNHLVVEDCRTGAIRKSIGWMQIESMTAGEPESDNALLFQG
jgi:hypothetical protein